MNNERLRSLYRWKFQRVRSSQPGTRDEDYFLLLQAVMFPVVT
jgi:hypothetical protein